MTFKDSVETDLEFTDDADALRSAVESLSATGGSDRPEDNFDAIATALDLGFRDDAQKIVVDITDAPSHYDGDGSGVSEHTMDEIADLLTASGAAYIAVAPDQDDPDASKKTLANEIGGLWIDIASADFSLILEEITEVVVTAYVVEYITDAAPGESRTVGVEVTDPEEGTGSVTGELEIPEDVGGGISRFESTRSEKLELAESVTNMATSINERDRAESTLEELSEAIDDGSVDASTAVEAAERLKLGENVSESTLSVLGPRTLDSPEDPNTFVGAPADAPAADSSFNLAGRSIENTVKLMVSAWAASRAFKEVAFELDRMPEAASFAEEILEFAVETLLGGFEEIVEPVQDLFTDASNAILGDINNDGVEAGDQLAGTVDGLFDEVSTSVSDSLLYIFEQVIPGNPLDNQLAEFDAELTPDDEGLSLEGNLSDAETSASDGIKDINQTVQNYRSLSEALELGSEMSLVLGGLGTAMLHTVALAKFGAVLKIAGVIFKLAFNVINDISAVLTLGSVGSTHSETLDNVVTGAGGG